MREAQAVQPGTVLKSGNLGNLGNQFLKGSCNYVKTKGGGTYRRARASLEIQ